MTLKIKLATEDRKTLQKFVKKGVRKARTIARANVLLLADKGRSNKEISETVGVHRKTIWQTKKRYKDGGLKHILKEKQDKR